MLNPVPAAWRLLAIAALLLCTAAAAEPEYWGEGSTEYARDYGDTVAQCARYKGVQPPAADRPSAAEMAALKDCDSTGDYYGIEGAADFARARRCAFAEMARGDNGGPVGSGVLMMLYANGQGVKRNLPYAIRMACTTGGAPYEVAARVSGLTARMTDSAEADEPFDFCDDITSGYAGGQCAMIDSRRRDAERAGRIGAVSGGWNAAQREAYSAVRATQAAYTEAMVEGEVDLSGTLRGAFALVAEAGVKDFDMGLLEDLAGGGPAMDPGGLARDDGALNAIYRRLMAQDFEGMGTITRDGVRTTQRAWLKHRDAWRRFVALTWPGREDAAVAALTRERTRMLRCMLTDNEGDDRACDA